METSDDNRCFQILEATVGRERFKCNVCPRSRIIKSITSLNVHKNSGVHKINLTQEHKNQERLRQENEEVQMDVIEDPIESFNEQLEDVSGYFEPEVEELNSLQARQEAVSALYYHDQTHHFESPMGSAASSYHDDAEMLNRRCEDETSNSSGNSGDDEGQEAAFLTSVKAVDQEVQGGYWYPFRKKVEAIGMLLLGSTRNVISRSQYSKTRSLVALCNLNLPEWSVLRRMRNNMKERLQMVVTHFISPLGTPCFSLRLKDIVKQELGNPYVRKHLVTIPELATSSPINRVSQSKRWRETLQPDLRLPMIKTKEGHFYIYELVQLCTGNKVVPCFFYQTEDCVMAKCVVPSVRFKHKVGKFEIKIPQEPAFDSPDFKTIAVSQFFRSIEKIEAKEGVNLKPYCEDNMLLSKDNTWISIPLLNPWRTKANTREIRHIPIMLYSDDTSGNVSKKWNKHMAFYCTLAGLPPKMTNQDYNIHFISTSNSASALELADGVVDELSDIATNGFEAVDHATDEKVLVMVVVLAHLGDSPMHAEVTNSMNPATALRPCRMCYLGVDKKLDKRKKKYIGEFVGIDENGSSKRVPLRDWDTTRARTTELWELSKDPGTIDEFNKRSTKYGIRDTLNAHFVKQAQIINKNGCTTDESKEEAREAFDDKFGEHLKNSFLRMPGFNGHLHTPVEVLHVWLLGIVKYLFRDAMKGMKATDQQSLLARWAAFDIDGLDISPIIPKTMYKHYNSLVGKEFRVVLQAAPFVLFEDLSPKKRMMWIALCHLGTYIFQTEINDMPTYLTELQAWINVFLRETIKLNAMWTNKPKFHMLTHLADSIALFGPACLFSTENFEGYNGNTRDASVHSNRQSPGRDIAHSFNTYRLLCLLLCGARFIDEKLRINHHTKAGEKLIDLFEESPTIRKALGYNSTWNSPYEKRIIKHSKKVLKTLKKDVPEYLTNTFPEINFESIEGIGWKKRMNLKSGGFLSVCPHIETTNGFVGFIKSIWKNPRSGVDGCQLEIIPCKFGDLNKHYGMMELSKKEKTTCWISAGLIEGLLNVQHNCHNSKCSIKATKDVYIERSLTSKKEFEVVHEDKNSFILNSGGFYSAAIHRRWANFEIPEVTPAQWKHAIEKGLKAWEVEVSKQRKQKQDTATKAAAVATKAIAVAAAATAAAEEAALAAEDMDIGNKEEDDQLETHEAWQEDEAD